jgi:hypothetical protein
MNKGFQVAWFLLALLSPLGVLAASIDEVTLLTKVQPYEAVVDTTLVTQEGKRIAVERGARLNVIGFTPTEAFVVSRKDKPNAFVRRRDIAPVKK